MRPALTGLFVYPVKSAAGIAADAWALDDFGLRHDRRWAVVDAAGDCLTQRTHPALALIRPSLDDDTLQLEVPGRDPLRVPIEASGRIRLPVTIWGDRPEVESCGVEAGCWVSEYLGEPCHLVHMPASTRRAAEASRAGTDARVSLVDAFPLLLLSDASLAGLNARLETPVPMNRFRPNLVVGGVAAHAEDAWDTVRIGAVTLVAAKPCKRCVITTVDQATTVAGVEPLRTLAQYRRANGGVCFGQNFVHRGTGMLRLGDAADPVARA